MNTKKLTATALLLALCLMFQMLKSISVYLTGPMVNAILIVAAVLLGIPGGAVIAVCSPLFAWLLGATPVVNTIPAMLPVIMAGNLIIVLSANLLWKKSPVGSLLAGSVLKALWLWLMVWFAVLPVFGAALPEKMVASVRATFSVTQLITALIGSAVAYIVIKRLGRFFKLD